MFIMVNELVEKMREYDLIPDGVALPVTLTLEQDLDILIRISID